MKVFAVVAGFLLLAVVLLDAFQSIILPRRPVGRFRITRIFFVATWQPWRWIAERVHTRSQRDQFYSVYGPSSLLVLFFVWACLLTFGFGFVFYGLRVPFHDPMLTGKSDWARLRSCLYVSGTTIFTLGLGDVVPQSQLARLLTVVEAGTGLGFVALVIGYVPVLYSSFSQREVQVALLDARAGSPPTVTELLLRHNFEGGPAALTLLLEAWERWCAEMLESHISYPILCYYRSQHDNQSWLSALTTILDTCALLISTLDSRETRQAQLTFAVGRHVLVDLVHVFQQEAAERAVREAPLTRLPEEELGRLCEALTGTDFAPCASLRGEGTLRRLHGMRLLYEPSACAMAEYLKLGLPHWIVPVETQRKVDTWAAMKRLKVSGEDGFVHHVSAKSTAVHLETHDEESEI